MPGHYFVAIEGVIGVGKTSLARLLQRIFEAETVLEIVEENPFLSSFYQDQAKYAFQTQIFFLLNRFRQMQVADHGIGGAGFGPYAPAPAGADDADVDLLYCCHLIAASLS